MAPSKKTVVKKDAAVVVATNAVAEADPGHDPAHGEAGQVLGEGREKTLAVVTHVLGLLTLFLGPLVMYFIFKGKASSWLRAHLDEAINYHLLLVGAFILIIVGLLFLSAVTIATTILAILLLLLVAAHVIFGAIAVIQSARGRSFHYPLDVKIVR